MSTTFPFDTKSHKYVEAKQEKIPQANFLTSILQRNKTKLASLSLTATIGGLYSLPDGWKQKIDDPAEQAYQYEIRFQGLTFKGGKVQPRLLTEEEKAELEAAKNKKPGNAPPKDDKKKKGQEEEVSAEEKERIEREAKEKEEALATRKYYWDQLGPNEKFEQINEDPYKEPSIKFITKNEDETTKDAALTIELSGKDLQNLEKDINENYGCWLYFDKLTPPEEEDPKGGAKGKAPVKGKGPAEDLKPVHGRAWVDLTQLTKQGYNLLNYDRRLLQTIIKPQEGVEVQQSDSVFENAQTYVIITVQLSEAINPEFDYYQNVARREGIDTQCQTMYKSPSTDSSIVEFIRMLGVVSKDISHEYTKMFSGEGGDDKDSPRGKPNSTVYSTPAQQREMRENRKEKFLLDFNTSPKYQVLRDKLKKAILRIAVEKYQRTVTSKGMTAQDRDKFKAELYCFLNEQMRIAIPQIIDFHTADISQDIRLQKEALKEDKTKMEQKSFKETDVEKAIRLYNEFDLINDKENAEKQAYMRVFSVDDGASYVHYGKFALKYGMHLKAQYYFNKKIEKNNYYWAPAPQEEKMKDLVANASLHVQQGLYREALVMINEVLNTDWKNIQANILMGLLYDKLERPGLSRKYFAIAKCKRLRDLNLLPPKSTVPKNYRTQNTEYKIEMVDFVMTKDQQLSYDQSDQLYFEVIENLLEYNISDLADFTLGYIKDKNSDRYLMTQSRIKVLQGKYLEAVQSLDRLLSSDQKNQKAWILRGHAYFLNNNLFDSEESYIKALRIKPTPKDPALQERLGIVYAKRKAWKDAKIVFQRCCKEFTSTTSWIYLGLSSLRLGELAIAEDAFTQANILDNFNPKTWGYMTILCLTVGKDRKIQAELCFKEALLTGLKDIEILEEIGDLYVKESCMELAVQSYEELVKIYPKHGEAWQKLGDVSCNNQNLKQERVKAINAYKQAIELVEGEGNKQKIALTLQEILQGENREDEIEPYRKYLMDQSLTN